MSLLSLKHVHTYSPDRITLRNETPIIPTNSEVTSAWYLPSKDELLLMYTNLKINGVGNFRTTGTSPNEPKYWSSTCAVEGDNAFFVNFNNGTSSGSYKSTVYYYVRATRMLTSTNQYELGDETANGFIYHITDNLNGTFTYREAAKNDCDSKSIWSNVFADLGTTLSDLDEGLNNTNEIMAQEGHITSAALIATQYASEVSGSKTVHDFIDTITADLFVFNTTTKINTASINILNKLYTNPRAILFTNNSSIIADTIVPNALQSYIDQTRTTYAKSSLSTDHVLINEIVDNQFAVMTSSHNGPTATIDTEFYTPEFYITKTDLGITGNIPSGVYTLKGTIVYHNTIEEDFELNIVYYASIAVCIRQKLNEFVLDCNQCRNTDDVVPFFIAESAFQSLQYYEESVLDVTAINKIMAALNMFCNQKTCTTC
jgi:hypothetical protein